MHYKIQFPDPMLMTLDTPHGTYTKFLKKCLKKEGKIKGKNKGKIIFSTLWFLIKKLNHNSGLHAKNQRDISKNKVRRPPSPTLCMEMWTFPFDNRKGGEKRKILVFFTF